MAGFSKACESPSVPNGIGMCNGLEATREVAIQTVVFGPNNHLKGMSERNTVRQTTNGTGLLIDYRDHLG
jgi:hypothetical protein